MSQPLLPDANPSPALLHGRHVFLRPVDHRDYESIRSFELGDGVQPLWRHRGATPSMEQWIQSFWSGVLAQFIVGVKRGGNPLGLVCVYDANAVDGHAFIAATKFDLSKPAPEFIGGLALFIDYVFSYWNFQKLYFESSELNLPQFEGAIGTYIQEEGRLRNHRFVSGRLVDVYLFAMYRDQWLGRYERHRGRI